MNINKQELLEAATKAMLEEGLTWWDEAQLKDGVVLHWADAAFVAIANPATVLALLDELEAAERRIGELESERDKQGRHACELFDEVTAQRQRITELEAREVGPVCQVLSHDAWVDLSKGAMESQKRTGATVRTLYTAPPAPVAIDERAEFNAWNNDTDCPLAGLDAKTAAWLAWSRRAAILQGKAEPVSQRDELPEGWVSVPVELTCEMDDAAWDAYHDTRTMSDIWAALLAAAPQQKVETALAQGMARYGNAMQELAKREVK